MTRDRAVIRLPSGAEARRSGPAEAATAVVCMNGGRGGEVEGTWSASLEWLVGRVAPTLPELAFWELRYRIKSWNRLDWCAADAREAMEATGAKRIVLLGFSMGGAVAIRVADDPRVDTVVGLAPWLPARLDLSPLRGRRLRVIHGSLDRRLPGIPGVSPASSRGGFGRARAQGATGEYTLVRGALHGIALRTHRGRPIPLPRARAWARLVAGELRDAARAAPRPAP